MEQEQKIQPFIHIPGLPYSLDANLYHTPNYKNISGFISRDDTPGNVGICFSGGGSIAMMAAMGQLRALAHMGFLDQTKAVSTVSGGSWATVPFIYLPDNIKDEDFLNIFVADPSELTTTGPEDAKNVSYLPKGNMGEVVANRAMSWEELLGEAIDLYNNPLFPNNHNIWKYLIAEHVLKPFGLAPFEFDTVLYSSTFAYSAADAAKLRAMNKPWGKNVYNYQMSSENRIKRPFHLCNAAMFITPEKDDIDKANEQGFLVAPVQSHAFGTGILGSNIGTYTKDKQVGEGLVSSYAFDSKLKEVNGNDVKVEQLTGFSLADITAASSAFFAAMVKDKIEHMEMQFKYWSVDNPQKDDGTLVDFGDGGTVDNTGIASLLAFNDIDNIVYFSNALQTVYVDSSNTTSLNIVVDLWIPPLFGYTPYAPKGKKPAGYVLYSELKNKGIDVKDCYANYQNNQVFDSSRFEEAVNGLYKASNGYNMPSVYYQENLEVCKNDWFSVDGGKTINILWVHHGPVMENWYSQLADDVKEKIDAYVAETKKLRKEAKDEKPTDDMFPNFVITQTHMPKEILNCFAHLTSWITAQQESTLAKIFS